MQHFNKSNNDHYIALSEHKYGGKTTINEGLKLVEFLNTLMKKNLLK